MYRYSLFQVEIVCKGKAGDPPGELKISTFNLKTRHDDYELTGNVTDVSVQKDGDTVETHVTIHEAADTFREKVYTCKPIQNGKGIMELSSHWIGMMYQQLTA